MKGISTVISAALIVAIALGLTSTAYIWGTPLIQKRQEASITENVYNQFSQSNQNSLPKMIEDVANNRGTRSFTISAGGAWKLNAEDPVMDSIEFTFASKTSNIATDTQNPISLTSGVQCTGTTPSSSPSPPIGTVGQDSSSVVCVKAISQPDIFTITYKVWFRALSDNPLSPTQTFKIDLVKEGLDTSAGKTIKITFDDSIQSTPSPGQTLITKKIKILLI